MNSLKSIPIGVHGALEVLAAPLLIVAPFVLGFGIVAGALSIALGALLIGLAVSIFSGEGESASVSLTAHAGLELAARGWRSPTRQARAPPPPESSWSGSASRICGCPRQRGTAARSEPEYRLPPIDNTAVHISLLPVVPQERPAQAGRFYSGP